MAILAIDQGQSKTVAAIAGDDGKVLGLGFAAGACHFLVGMKRAAEVIGDAMNLALKEAGLKKEDIRLVVGGLAGANWPDEFLALEAALRQLTGVDEVRVYNDCVIALRGGTDSADAIVLCAGSNFNVAVMAGGELKTVLNNYIEPLDQGSEGLARRAMQAIFRAHVGMQKQTILSDMVMRRFGFTNMDDLLLAYDRNRLDSSLISLASILFEAADQNDEVALRIVYEFGASIARYVGANVRKYGLDPEKCEIVLSGGLFKTENPLLHETVCAHIHASYSDLSIVSAKYEPVVGALLLGFDCFGPRDDIAHSRCKEGAERMGWVRNKREGGGSNAAHPVV